MKNSLQNKIWIVQISSYVIWTNKCISNISKINQSCIVWSSEQVHNHISRWHTNILQNKEKAWKTCQKNSKKTSRKKSLFQIREMQILQTMSQISKTHCHNQRIENEFRENKNNNRIFNIQMHQEHTSISRINKILSKIYYKFHWNHHIINQFITKK